MCRIRSYDKVTHDLDAKVLQIAVTVCGHQDSTTPLNKFPEVLDGSGLSEHDQQLISRLVGELFEIPERNKVQIMKNASKEMRALRKAKRDPFCLRRASQGSKGKNAQGTKSQADRARQARARFHERGTPASRQRSRRALASAASGRGSAGGAY